MLARNFGSESLPSRAEQIYHWLDLDPTGNRPGIFHSRRQRRSVEAAHLVFEEYSWGSHTTKTDVVVVIVGVVAVRHTQVVIVISTWLVGLGLQFFLQAQQVGFKVKFKICF